MNKPSPVVDNFKPCAKCGILTNRTYCAECEGKPSDTIQLSRKVAEEWFNFCGEPSEVSSVQYSAIYNELRKALESK